MIYGVRGTLELPGFGEMGSLITELEKIPGTESKAIDYPAGGIVLGEEPGDFKIIPWIYSASKTTGGDVLRNELYNLVEFCPKTSIVLMGYSQVSSGTRANTQAGYRGEDKMRWEREKTS